MYEALDQCNLAWGDIKTTAEAYDSPPAEHRGSSVAIDARDGSTRRVSQTPYRFSISSSGLQPDAVAPYRGEHNSEILQGWLNTSQHEIETLSQAGVLLEENNAEEI